MGLVAINSGETFGVDSRIEGLFPCGSSSAVMHKDTEYSQCVFFVLSSLAGLKRDLDSCGGSRSNWKAGIRCYMNRRWLRWNVDFFPVKFIVVTVELRGNVVKVVHRTMWGDALRGLLIRTRHQSRTVTGHA